MKEDYAANMALKTDAQLREYVTGHYQYREEAVLAAFDELRTRSRPAPEEDAMRPGLETEAAARNTQEAALRAEAPAGAGPAVPEEEATSPELYSPTTIILFSAFFSIIAGAVLLGMNLGRLGRWRAVAGLVVFIASYLLLGSMALLWLISRFGMHTWYGLLFNIPAILAYIFWFWPRYVGVSSFRSRAWLPPLLACLLLLLIALPQLNVYMKKQLERQPKEVREKLERLMPQ